MSAGILPGLPTRLVVMAFVLVFCPLVRAAENPGNDAINQLSQTIYAQTVTINDNGPALFRALYWLRMATTLNDLSPVAALRSANERARRSGNHASLKTPINSSLGPAMFEDQLLADWHIACLYGLFTPENLARLQAGAEPIATDGPFVGHVIQARKINPGNRYASIQDLALGPEDGPLQKDAVPLPSRPAFPVTAMPPPPPVNVPLSRGVPLASTPSPRTPSSPAYPVAPGNHAVHRPEWPPAAPPVAVPSEALAPTSPRILLQDVPFNGLLPISGKVKLGIAGVTGSEISVSIVGERQVVIKGGQLYGNMGTSAGGTYPSVDNYKVPKINPVRLPGISNDAYLIKDDATGRTGVEVRYHYIDASIDNGAIFRVAKVTGGL